jgi:SOS response regulatory protein OraA/RecX
LERIFRNGPFSCLLRLNKRTPELVGAIRRETARRAVDAVFQDVEEDALLERALARRLKTPDGLVRTPAEYRRLHDALVRQGFAPADVRKALDRRRAKSSEFWAAEGDGQD